MILAIKNYVLLIKKQFANVGFALSKHYHNDDERDNHSCPESYNRAEKICSCWLVSV